MKKSKVRRHGRKKSKGVKAHTRVKKGAESKKGAGGELRAKKKTALKRNSNLLDSKDMSKSDKGFIKNRKRQGLANKGLDFLKSSKKSIKRHLKKKTKRAKAAIRKKYR